MDAASVMKVWDEVETDAESEDSDGSMESEDVAAQEFCDDTSDEEDIAAPTTAPGPSRTTVRRARPRPVEYDWQEVNVGKEFLQDV